MLKINILWKVCYGRVNSNIWPEVVPISKVPLPESLIVVIENGIVFLFKTVIFVSSSELIAQMVPVQKSPMKKYLFHLFEFDKPVPPIIAQ